MSKDKKFIPAMGFGFLTPLYDPLVGLFIPAARIRNALIEDAGVRQGQRVLNFGSGTGTLLAMIKERFPGVEATGLDIDEKVISIAKKKTSQLGVSIDLCGGGLFPYKDERFCTVVTSFVLHHLDKPQKEVALKEVLRVLKKGGGFYIADFGPPKSFLAKVVSNFLRLFEATGDNIKGLIPECLKTAGFKDVSIGRYFNTCFGTVWLYWGRKG